MEVQRESANRKSIANANKNDFLKSIVNEYCLKRNSFYPANRSPNLFINKLELRMKKYYNTLNTSDSIFNE
jgi:hypothetical protein